MRQLTAYTRRLDHIVADLADAERLVRGDVELTVRRTDLEALVKRVVEESGIDADHEVQVETERVVGRGRPAADRADPGRAAAVLGRPHAAEEDDHGATGGRPTAARLITVEDPEPSSDVSMSPVVQRFAEVQGGWATVESRDNGGSSFKVFLPDGAGTERR